MNELMTQEELNADLEYANDFIKAVNDAMYDIRHRSYFIGFRLDEANRYKYYETLGYASIADLAESEFGFKRSTTYGLIQAFNYAKSSTPLNMDERFRGYSYTALLEMSKAKTIKKITGTIEGIERILTPKDSVSTIKEVRPLWDKYITEHGRLPDSKTVTEFMELVREEQTPTPLPLLEFAEEPENKNSVQSIGLNAEAEDADDEFEAELNADCEEDFYTDDEVITAAITCRAGGKFEIYDKFQQQPLKAEFLIFLKELYGTGGYGGAGYKFLSADWTPGKGWTITRLSGKKIDLPWTYVAGRISRLIEEGKYLSAAEHDEYLQWKAEQDGLVVNVAAPAKLKTVDHGKKTNWEYLQSCMSSRSLFVHLIEKCVGSIPEDFGVGMPDRLRKWLQIWLEKPVEF